MKHYVHSVPGRLRIRNPLFKNEENHRPVRVVLSTLTGIKESEFRTTTGSITIFYDPELVQGNDIVRALERAGYFDSTQAMTNDEYVHHVVSTAGGFISRAVFGGAMDVALEGTGLAWLGLLI
jgi:hypothetical protein